MTVGDKLPAVVAFSCPFCSNRYNLFAFNFLQHHQLLRELMFNTFLNK